MTHRTELRVRFCEIDPYGHVNHSVYVQYFEDGRVEALADVGQGLAAMFDADAAMVISQISTRFLLPAFMGETLVVESGLSSMRRATATWQQRILRGDDVLATQIARVGCTTAAGRPRRVPESLAPALEGFVVAPDWLGGDAPR